jgi:hypothetical protein
MNQARFQKQQREKARREKALAKFARREERRNAPDEPQPPTTSPIEQAHLLAQLADLHARFDAGEIPYDDFLIAKDDLTQRLHVD